MSPDFALNLVPFAALVDEEGRYLVERCALTYLASGRDLLRLTTRVPPRRGPVVVAAPDYEAVLPSSVPSHGGSRSEPAAGIGAIRFEPLRFAAEEGRAIARKLPGSELLTGADATESAVKRLAAPSLLHIATHGFFLPGRPESSLLRSGIALAGANRRHGHQDDGVLTALEVSQLDLTGTRLVVLSACLTGVGEVTSGDGVYGLRRALVMAGAETQVMSLWGVDDAATCDLMEAYYEKLLAEEGRGEALRRAQLEMLIRRPRAHPYYWASFIVSGNDAPLTEW